MNSRQAKEILHSYRPGDRDARDPAFAEALAQVQHDPELREWFEEQRRLDAVIGRKLKEVAAPPDLCAQIHEAMASRRIMRRRQFLALAACGVLLASLAGFWLAGERSEAKTPFAMWRQDMAEFLNEFPALDVETERMTEIREWLATRHALTDVSIPVGLEPFPGLGCRTVRWRDREFALVCLMVDGEAVHLFVLHQTDFPNASLTAQARFTRVEGMSSASWASGGLAYVVLTRADEDFLRRHLRG